MPTYEYECKSCSHGFEVFQSMSDPPLKDCPKCGKEVRRLILGGSGVIFKGSGFYVTDKGKSGKTAAKPASSQKTESASSGAAEKGDSASKSPSTSAAADSGSSGSGSSAPAEKSKPESKPA